MVENQIKLLVSAFVAIIIGIVLLGVIADDVEQVQTSSFSVTNETVTMSAVKTLVANETLSLIQRWDGGECRNESNGSLARLDPLGLIEMEIHNSTSGEIVTGDCNFSISNEGLGLLNCNLTNNPECDTVTVNTSTYFIKFNFTFTHS